MVSTAARVGSINVLFTATYGQAVQGANRFADAVERGGIRMQRSVTSTDRSVLGLNRTMQSLRGREFRVLALSALRAENSVDRLRNTLLATSALVGGFGAAFTLRGLVEYSDTYKTVGNRLRIVKNEATDLRDVEKEIFDVAQRSRAGYEATGILYARLANSARQLKIEQKDILRVTETIQKSFLVGGATPVEAAQSSIQLSQGIASNRLQGDELRSVLENPALGQLLADQITGGDIGALRSMAKEGKLTAGVIIRAFKGASEEIDKLFATTQQTIGQAFVKIDNAMMRYIGTSENANDASRATVTLLNAIAENMDTVGDSIVQVGTAIGAVFGARTVSRIVAHIGTVRAMRIAYADAAAAQEVLAASEVKSARSDMISRRLAFNKALNEGVLSASQLERQQRGVAASIVNFRNAEKAAAAATLEHVAATRAASVSGMAFAGAGRAASSAWAFLGGPVGVALLALGAILFAFQANVARADDELRKFAEAGETVKNILAGIESRASSSAEGFDRFAEGFRKIIDAEGITRAQADIQKVADGIGNMGRQLQELARQASAQSGDIGIGAQITELTSRFRIGQISLDEFVGSLDDLAVVNPDLSKVIADMIDTARQSDDAASKINMARIELANLDGSEAEVKVKVTFDQTKAIAKDLVEQRDDLLKEAFKNNKPIDDKTFRMFSYLFEDVKQKAPKKERADEYDRLIKRISEATSELANETAVQAQLNPLVEDYGYALAKAKAQHDLLNAAREAGKKITPEIAANIAKEAEAYAQATAAAERLKEQNDRIREESDFQKEIFKDFISVLNDGKVSWKEMGDVALSVLDKVINKVEDQLLDAMFKVGNAGGGNFLSNIFSSLFGGGVPGGSPLASSMIAAGVGGLFHSGGDAGAPTQFRRVSISDIAGAKRFHTGRSGIGHNEVMAVLEKTESVFTGRQTNRVANALSANAGAMAPAASGNIVINNQQAPGYETETKRSRGPNGEIIINMVAKRVASQYGLKKPVRQS